MQNTQETKPLLIIDGYGFIFRAYHVHPKLSSPNGIPVGAIYGFTSMLMKLIRNFRPEQAIIVLDHSGKNFRHDLYQEYKANRPPAPDDLVVQLKLVQKAAEALNFSCISKAGFEADDIIATLASRATESKKPALIISSDKDLMQLINEHVKMYDPAKSKYITDEDIKAKFGVEPAKVREVQALMGDSSDNIPGVAGIGLKTASQLINQFGDLKGVFAAIDQVKNPRQKKLLTEHQEEAFISWKLVGLDHNVDIKQNIDDFRWQTPDAEKISEFINEYGFKSLNKNIESLFNVKIINTLAHAADLSENSSTGTNTVIETDSKEKIVSTIEVINEQQLEPLRHKIKRDGCLAISIVRDDNMIKIALSDGQNIYLLPYKKQQSNNIDLFSYSNNAENCELEKSGKINFNKQIHDLCADASIKKITYNLKELLKIFDCDLRSFDDLQIMEYVLNAGKKQKIHNAIIEFLDLYKQLRAQLFENKALHLYENIDLPLCYILDKMEKEGVKIDINHLQKLSSEFAKQITLLEQKIFDITGEEFNIASPKQLGEILFDKMKLPFAKTSSKTKSYSTNATILEKLQEEGFEIADLLLKHRHLSKLKNTYTDSLPKLANPQTSRVHTSFLQTATSTGRLSSANPNVQNIPTRSEEGSSIRSAFIAKEGTKLISADYSQIELRILSHVADIKSLKQAFAENRDIHSQTASQIFSVPLSEITPDLRHKAKAINFGIIYGISAFGLARGLNISRKAASDYIDRYFKEYPGIQEYMDKTIEFAKQNNFVENLIGRKCFVPNINNKNHALRSFGARAAINAPMQSLASDIIKIAMINIDKQLTDRSMQTKMILQIHDELIFEVPVSEVQEVAKLIKSTMENAIRLDVKTNVELNISDNWQKS